MKLYISFFILFCILLFQTTELNGQTTNYSGTWVLNLEKSKLETQPAGFTGSVFIIRQEGDKLHLTRYHIFGDRKKKISFTMIADGKTRSVKLLYKGKLEWKENTLLSTLYRKNFLNIVQYQFGLDQNEFIADEQFTGLPGNHHNIWVFDREIPESGQ